MCGIYKIINKINNKIYVGQSVNIQKRWYQHLYDANHRLTIGIDQAIKKYGAENWQHIHSDVYTEENKLWHSTYGVGHSEDQLGLSSDDRTLKQEEIDKIYLDYTQNHMSIRELSKKYNRDYGVIEKYINNPKEVSQVKYKGRKIQNIETKKIFNSISSAAKWALCGATTITRHLYDNKPAGKVPDTLENAHWIEI